MSQKLDDMQLRTSLDTITEWEYDEDENAIVREFEFEDFIAAFSFMTSVAFLAEKAGHHPDWANSYNSVTIALSTHDAEGVTDRDIALARQIDKLITEA